MRRKSHYRVSASRRDGQRGFALLIVFLLAAAVALLLYQEMPRVAFETVREREQLLMDRGNQYRRAIQVFYAVNKRYPQKIEELEKTNEQRFLRRRYKDPFTGSEEWRLVHSNGATLTDSLVEPAPTVASGQGQQGQLPGAGPLGSNVMNTASAAQGASADGAQVQEVNAAVARRPADRLSPGEGSPAPVAGPATGDVPTQNPGGGFDPSDPRTWPAISLSQVNQGQQNGQRQVPAAQLPPGMLINNGTATANVTANDAAQALGLNQNLGSNNGLNINGIGTNQGTGNGNNFNAGNQNAANPNTNAAITQINNQLMRPSSAIGIAQPTVAGTNATPTTAGTASAQTGASLFGLANNAVGGLTPQTTAGVAGTPGIAGVASRFEGPSIKSLNERTKYQEWEFIYKPAPVTGAAAGLGGTGVPGQQGGGRGGQQNGPQNPGGLFPGAAPANGPAGDGRGPGRGGNGGFGGMNNGGFNFPPLSLPSSTDVPGGRQGGGVGPTGGSFPAGGRGR